jgi:hypothetical protein
MYKLIIILNFLLVSCVFSQQNPFGEDKSKNTDVNPQEETKKTELTVAQIHPDGILYGAEIDPNKQVMQIKDVFSAIDKYIGNVIVVEGIISESCRAGGCWIVIKEGDMEIRALTRHKFVLPLDQPVGVKAVVEGEFDVKEITEDQAKHFAEESGDMKKAEEIKGSQTMYRIIATGIKILN